LRFSIAAGLVLPRDTESTGGGHYATNLLRIFELMLFLLVAMPNINAMEERSCLMPCGALVVWQRFLVTGVCSGLPVDWHFCISPVARQPDDGFC